MSADLREAVEAAAEYQFGLEAARLGIDAAHLGQAWDDAEPIVKHIYRESVLGAVAAAAPVIEAAVRAEVDAQIRTERMRIKGSRIDAEIRDQYARGHLYGLSSAAHIASGAS